MNKAATAAAGGAVTPEHHVPGKVVAFRIAQWRKWAANALMAQPERNRRVLAALVLAGDTRAVARDRFADVATKVAGFEHGGGESLPLRQTLEQADRFDAGQAATLVQAVAAAAAYGIDNEGLESLLNYLEVDEAKAFVLDGNYLDLLTVSELESLAEEVGLRKAMGSAYQKARAGKRADFIKGLLAVAGFPYAGAVPKAMRYPRRGFKPTDRTEDWIDASPGESSAGAAPVEAESVAA
jgi:ParB family transcriptional regulator, chromosome partitioning protein